MTSTSGTGDERRMEFVGSDVGGGMEGWRVDTRLCRGGDGGDGKIESLDQQMGSVCRYETYLSLYNPLFQLLSDLFSDLL